MKDVNYEDGYKEGLERGGLVEFDSQKDFKEKISNLILQGIEQGFSTKGIYENLNTLEEYYYHKKTIVDIIRVLKERNIDVSNIKMPEIE